MKKDWILWTILTSRKSRNTKSVLITTKKNRNKVDDFYRKTVGVAKTFHCTTNLIEKKIYGKILECLMFLEYYILKKN